MANNFCYVVPDGNISNDPANNGIKVGMSLNFYGPDIGFFGDGHSIQAIVDPGNTLATVASALRAAIQAEAATIPNNSGGTGITVPAGNILIPTFQFL